MENIKIHDSPWLDFAVNETIAEIRLAGLSLAARGLWLTLLLLIVQYRDPDERDKSLPMSLHQISRLVGSHPHTVRKILDELDTARLIVHNEHDVLENLFPYAEGDKY